MQRFPAPRRDRHRASRCAAALLAFAVHAACLLVGCDTIDKGDNFVPPDVMINEDFFYCRIQPEVISVQKCASGAAGDSGGCHASRSALRLDATAENEPPPVCDGNMVTGVVSPSYQNNLEAIRFTVRSDPLSSPVYRRPVGLDSHPRQIFGDSSTEAQLIVEWIASGSM